MKLPRRILDLVRAGLFSWRGVGGEPAVPSPQGVPTEMRDTHESLARAQATRQRLQGVLEAAEREGRDKDASSLRQQVQELSGSIEQLQAALELMQSRVKAARAQGAQPASPVPNSQTPPGTASDLVSGAASGKPDDLEARKTRLSGGR